MKIKLLMTGMLAFVTLAAVAQKGELNNAKEKYDEYTIAKSNKLTMPQAKSDLADAKTSIDKAAVNTKTAELPLTFAVKGEIYSSLTLADSIPANSAANFKIADEALKKAKSLDSVKKENAKMINDGFRNLAQYKFDEGRGEFAEKKFDLAYKSFDYFRQVLPDDTLASYVTGLAAANEGYTDPKYFQYAISSYNKLLTTNFSRNATVYNDLASIYLASKDTTNALKTIAAGVDKYPADNNLRRREIEIGLQSGKQDELIGKIQTAIAADPKNKTLYYYEGLTYSQIAEAINKTERRTKDPVAKDALQKKKLDNFAKAADGYKQAIAIDPDYFEATLNLGYVLINPAIDAYNAANQLPTNQQKQYDAAIAAANVQFAAAKPYLLKAVDLNPKSVDALGNLKTYYLGTKDTADANATQKKIDALGGQ